MKDYCTCKGSWCSCDFFPLSIQALRRQESTGSIIHARTSESVIDRDAPECVRVAVHFFKRQSTTMLSLFIRFIIPALIILIVSELARRSPRLGALLLTLPLISILAFGGGVVEGS